MLYFKHSELVDKYHVSLKTVHNWIDAAKAGKLELELFDKNNRKYIAKSSANEVVLEKIVSQGKKYRNVRFHKVVTPKPAFYEIYNRRQILDIITNLKVHREIPRQYNYFNGGADHWDRFARMRWEHNTPNLLKSTIELLELNLGPIETLLQGRTKVNVIDIGPGNAMPVKRLLQHLVDQGTLHRYIAIDVSESMLKIAQKNIEEWFGSKVKFEGYVRDIAYDRFDDLVVDDMLGENAGETINLALLLGATPMNFRDPYTPLRVIAASLGRDDLLIYTDKPDTEKERRSFDINDGPQENNLSNKYSFMLDLLGINGSLYDVKMGFDKQKRIRYIQVKLKTSVTIQLKFDGEDVKVDFEKGDVILVLRVWHQTVVEIVSGFEKSGFSLLQSSLTKDREYLLTISGIETRGELGNPANS